MFEDNVGFLVQDEKKTKPLRIRHKKSSIVPEHCPVKRLRSIILKTQLAQAELPFL